MEQTFNYPQNGVNIPYGYQNGSNPAKDLSFSGGGNADQVYLYSDNLVDWAALKEAGLKLQRRRNLAEKETISEEVLASAQLAVDLATAAYQQVLASAELAKQERDRRQVPLQPAYGAAEMFHHKTPLPHTTSKSVLPNYPGFDYPPTFNKIAEPRTFRGRSEHRLRHSGEPSRRKRRSRKKNCPRQPAATITTLTAATGKVLTEFASSRPTDLGQPKGR